MWSKRECRLLWLLGIALFLFPLFAEANEVTASEPVVTWNLFLTLFLVPLCVVLLGAFFGRKMDKQQAGWDAYHKEVKENLGTWQKEIKGNIGDVKTAVDEIKEDVGSNITRIECEKKSDDKWRMINHHHHDEKGKVAID